VKYGRSKRERWYLYGKSARLVTGGTNGEVGSGCGTLKKIYYKVNMIINVN
jgi:hypothetical protein